MLLDTDVLVDLLRGHPPAVAWLAGLGATTLGLPGLVAMELLQGCQDLTDQQRVQGYLQRFTFYWPAAADCERAYHYFAVYRLTHNLGLLDALIGETDVGLGQPLATFHVKHYGVIPGLQTIQPY